jgi:RNA polymerase sigma-B factor
VPLDAERHRPLSDLGDARRRRADRVLFERYADPDDPVDRDAVIERFLPLARRLAGSYARGAQSYEDLFQVACLALVRAVDGYDPSRHTAFSTYAVPTINGELKKYFRDKTWALHVPRDLHDLGLKLQRRTEKLSTALGRPPTIAELAAATEASEAKVREALQALDSRRAAHLDAVTPEQSRRYHGRDPLMVEDEGFHQAEHRATIEPLMRRLTRRQREVVRLHFEDDLTQHEIGRRIGVSQMQVSRIMRESLTRLREIAGVAVPEREAA